MNVKLITHPKYKYELLEPMSVLTSIIPEKNICIKDDAGYIYIILDHTGVMTVNKGYAWDGPSGPTLDTMTFMTGSLYHDALYQMMREGCLDYSCRKLADELLQDQCLIDGMSEFRAWYVYWGVRLFGGNFAKSK